MNGDFSDKLGQILSDPNMMAQIKALADTMTAGGAAQSAEEVPMPPQRKDVSEEVSVPAFFTPSPAFEKNMKNY